MLHLVNNVQSIMNTNDFTLFDMACVYRFCHLWFTKYILHEVPEVSHFSYGEEIERLDCFKYLGMILDDKMTIDDQI